MRLVFALANVIWIGCLVWSLRDFKFGALIDDLKTMNWWWVVLAVAGDITVYVLQASRWRLLLHPIEPVSLWKTIRAVYVALFANEILGFNAGEVVRCYLISRWTALPFSVSISSALIERLFDGIWLCACLFVTLRIVVLPHHMRYLVDSGYVLGGLVLVGALLLGIAMFHRHKARAALAGTSWRRHLRVLIDDLSLIGHSRFLYFAFLVSLPYLLFQIVPIWASFKGYGFDELSLGDALALMVILRMGSAVPQAPGNIGLYLLTKQSLTSIFNVVPRDAENFAVVFWGIITLRLLIGGVVTLFATGAKFGELRRAARAESSELSRSRT
jgi:uncharacterized protein (TIRG00374 family)